LCDIDPDDKAIILGTSAYTRASEGGKIEEAIAAINESDGICAVHTRHTSQPPIQTDMGLEGILSEKGLSVYIYSTPEARRYLRRLAKVCKTQNLTLTTRIAVSCGYGCLRMRHKYRAYVVECHRAAEGATLDGLWECMRAAATKIE
jgi:hypothetical protein